MIAVQLFLSSIILFLIYRSVISFRKGHLSAPFLIVWVTLWIIGIFFIFEQKTLAKIANMFGIGRGVDLAIYLLIIVIMFFLYLLFEKIEKIQEDITKIARKVAIQSTISNKSKHSK